MKSLQIAPQDKRPPAKLVREDGTPATISAAAFEALEVFSKQLNDSDPYDILDKLIRATIMDEKEKKPKESTGAKPGRKPGQSIKAVA